MNTQGSKGYWIVNGLSLAEERWRIVDEGDRWAVWAIPQNQPECWRELAEFSTETEAVDYVKSL